MHEDVLKLAKEIASQIKKEKDLPEEYRIETFKLLLQYKLGLGVSVVGKKALSAIETTGDDSSFSEFLNQIEEPKTNPQKFAAIAYYYKVNRGESSITQENIMATMKEAGLPTPKNFSRDMSTATSSKSPLLMQADPKEGNTAWQLTRTGRNFIEQKVKQP